MRRLTVELSENSYDILIENGLLAQMGTHLHALVQTDAPVAVITDETVWQIYRESFTASLMGAGLSFQPIVLPAGESTKSLASLQRLYDAFARMPLSRGGLIVTFGGGVIGDLGGFAAATWMRGVRFVQIPTTLLAQVDSSVGGKTAVNLPQGKNLVGAFYQPQLVLIDPSALQSLPPREMRCGLAEVIKYGAIRSPSILDDISKIPAALPDIISACCRIKSDIVSRDERDFGERMLLNFGHTFGHAIEKQQNYTGVNHGEAVALGMVIAAGLGETLGFTEPGVRLALREVLEHSGLAVAYEGKLSQLLPLLTADKKSDADSVSMVFLKRMGDAVTTRVRFPDIANAAERLDTK